MNLAAIIERATLVPFLVLGTYERQNGEVDTMIDVIEAPLAKPPFAEDTLGAANARRVVKASVFPATMFLDVRREDRPAFAGAFRYYQLWSRARAAGKPIQAIEPGVDYDADYMAAEFEAYLKGIDRAPVREA